MLYYALEWPDPPPINKSFALLSKRGRIPSYLGRWDAQLPKHLGTQKPTSLHPKEFLKWPIKQENIMQGLLERHETTLGLGSSQAGTMQILPDTVQTVRRAQVGDYMPAGRVKLCHLSTKEVADQLGGILRMKVFGHERRLVG
ncbi:hypothetical protein OWV82_008632 [Melia azedarach]|uniref:Uncharacterized protein n=1 Tax=Melia azedarach TaxID=155640 RepID=A0ACC1YBU4_MELAZ|nr:hypothetical protein OWV82_008632 [Melia azedarach]